jgi:hypothetical protein
MVRRAIATTTTILCPRSGYASPDYRYKVALVAGADLLLSQARRAR